MECKIIENIIHFFIKLFINKKIYSDNDPECIICMDNKKQIIFYPCRHLYCCKLCSKILDLCPICKSAILYKIKSK